MDFLNPLFEAIGWLLALFYSLVPNLGIAIILLTFTVMLILYPLTAKQAKSMIAMQRVQPEVKKLQAKYKGDRQKLNEEMMKFYQENKINPLAGCLPLLVQLPIFFALFRVLNDPEKYIPTDSDLYAALCSTAAGVVRGVEACARSVNHLTFLSMDLQLSATDAHQDALDAAPYFILVGLVILTGFLQTRQAQKRTPAANKQMGMVMRVLPIFFGLISLSFPAGLVLYFFVSNLWRLGQQEVIFRHHGSALHPSWRERREAKALGTVEAKSRVVEDDIEDAEVVEDEAPKPILPAKKPSPKAAPTASTGDDEPAETTKPSGKSTGGLRGLFALPPPPDMGGGGGGGGNGGGTARAGARPATTSSGSGGNPRPPQPRSRSRRKKKRKR
jgi:YidC/Oxa1 family membrane protein insertase